MEYFDILNKDGIPTGRVAPKGTDVFNDDYYLGVHAYLYNSKGEFLLQQRAKTKEFLPGGWDIHMGHVIAGETSKEAILREIREELGLNLNDITLVKRVCWEKYNHLIDIFIACIDVNLQDLVLQKSEVDNVKYVSKEEMLSLIKEMDYRPKEYRVAIKNYIENEFKIS